MSLDFNHPENYSKDDEIIILNKIRNDASCLQSAGQLKNDKDFVLKAIKANGSSFQYASLFLRNDKEVALEAVKRDGSNLQFVGPRCKEDEGIVLEAVERYVGNCGGYSHNILFAGEGVRDDAAFMKRAIRKNCYSILFASDQLKNNKALATYAIRIKGSNIEFGGKYTKKVDILKYVGIGLKNDKSFVLFALGCGCSLEHVCVDLKNDHDVVYEAATRNCKQLIHASTDFRENKSFIIEIIRKETKPKRLRYFLENTINIHLRRDRDIIMEIVKRNGSCLQFAGEHRSDKEIVLTAVRNDEALGYASIELRNDEEVVLEAVKKRGISLRYASHVLKKNKAIATVAIMCGCPLLYVDINLRNDIGFVMSVLAAKSFHLSLEGIGEQLKNDRDFFLKCLEKNGFLLEYASEELRNDMKIVMTAVEKSVEPVKYAGKKIKNNMEFLIELLKRDCNVLKVVFSALEDPLVKSRTVLEAIKSFQKRYPFIVVKNRMKSTLEFVSSSCGFDRDTKSVLYHKLKLYEVDAERALEEFETDEARGEVLRTFVDDVMTVFCHNHLMIPKVMVYDKIVKDGIELNKMLIDRLGINLGFRDESILSSIKRANDVVLKLRFQLWRRINHYMDRFDVSYQFFEDPRADVPCPNQYSVTTEQRGISFHDDLKIFRLLGRGRNGRTYLCKVTGWVGLYVVKVYFLQLIGDRIGREFDDETVKKDGSTFKHHKNTVDILYQHSSVEIDVSLLPDYEEYWKRFEKEKPLPKVQGSITIMKYHQRTLSKCIDLRRIRNLELHGRDRIFEPSEILIILRGILFGVFHLYSNKIIHRDIHTGNVYCHPPTGQIWVGDYGHSLDLRNNRTGYRVKKTLQNNFNVSSSCSSSHGTNAAPEILEEDENGYVDYSKSDLYSCGIVGRKLFDLVEEEYFRGEDNTEGEFFWKDSDSFLELVELMKKDFEIRIEFKDAVKKIMDLKDEFGR